MYKCGNCGKKQSDPNHARACYGFPLNPTREGITVTHDEKLSELPLLVKCEKHNCSYETEKSTAIRRSQEGLGCPGCDWKFRGIHLSNDEEVSELPLLVKCEKHNCSYETEKSTAIRRSQEGLGCPGCNWKFRGIPLKKPAGKQIPVSKSKHVYATASSKLVFHTTRTCRSLLTGQKKVERIGNTPSRVMAMSIEQAKRRHLSPCQTCWRPS